MQLTIQIPKGYMNLAVTKENNITGNTNNSANWDVFRFPLPEPPKDEVWVIAFSEGKTVVLTSKPNDRA